MLTELLHRGVSFSVEMVDALGYAGVVLLMFLESSFVPFPSELVMPQAGYLASQGRMNAAIAVAMGVVGSWLGALLNYYLALRLGRAFFLKYGRYLLCPPPTFAKVEAFFQRHGEIGTFTGRLVPVVRQYISLPAGLARMNMARFLFFTGLGSGIWVTILTAIGYVAGRNQELIRQYTREWTIWLMVFCAVLLVAYTRMRRRRGEAAPRDSA